MAAVDKMTGRTVWKSPGVGEPASYVSPIVAEYQGLRMILTMSQKSLIGVNAASGDLLWSRIETDFVTNHPWLRSAPAVASGEKAIVATAHIWYGSAAEGQARCFDADGRLSWSQNFYYPLNAAVADGDGGVVFIGGDDYAGPPHCIVGVSRLDRNGIEEWSSAVGSWTLGRCKVDMIPSILATSIPAFVDRNEETFRRDGYLLDWNPSGIGNRVRNGRARSQNRVFTNPFGTERSCCIRYFNNRRVDGGCVENGWKAVVDKVGVQDAAVLNDHLLEQTTTNPLGNSSLDLSFQGHRIDRSPDVMASGVGRHLDLPVSGSISTSAT